MQKQLTALLLACAFCLPFLATASPQDEKPVKETGMTEVDSGPLPLVLTLFIHDQLTPREIAGLSKDYLEWFIKELGQISDRRIQVISVTHKPGYTDFPYRQDSPAESLQQWRDRIVDYMEDNNLPMKTQRHKYVLLTGNKVSVDIKGIAYASNGVAIASVKNFTTLAHEIGHLLGATHENAEVLYSSVVPCRTLMYPTQTEFFASCYRFSDKNREAIAHYLDKI
jgi:hypothetical protein